MTLQEMIDRRRQLRAARELINSGDPRRDEMATEITELTRRIDAELMVRLGEHEMNDTTLREQAMAFALQVASIERKYANAGDVLRIAQQFYEWLSEEYTR